LMLKGRPFCPGSSQVAKPDSSLWARDKKAVSGVASSAITKKKEVQDNSFCQKGHDHQSWDNQLGCVHHNLQKLKQHYHWERPNRNPGDMLIQHDNARLHTNLWAQEAVAIFGWTVPPHSPYSPDLAPSDFHLFGPQKDALCGTRFEDDDSVICAVRTWVCEQETSWYREGMHALATIDIDGDYVGK
jgi:hypothetical protein